MPLLLLCVNDEGAAAPLVAAVCLLVYLPLSH